MERGGEWNQPEDAGSPWRAALWEATSRPPRRSGGISPDSSLVHARAHFRHKPTFFLINLRPVLISVPAKWPDPSRCAPCGPVTFHGGRKGRGFCARRAHLSQAHLFLPGRWASTQTRCPRALASSGFDERAAYCLEPDFRYRLVLGLKKRLGVQTTQPGTHVSGS